jgi:hypothetical protein
MFSVEVNDPQDRLWDVMSRWTEAVIGEIGVDWDFYVTDEHTIYLFAHEQHADQFRRSFVRDLLIFPFETWKIFCISDNERAMIERYWETKDWVPVSVVIDVDAQRCVSAGYRRTYNPRFHAWFFEQSIDVLMFYLENGNGKSHH